MAIELIEHSLELDENISLHKRGWKIQRFCWTLIFIFLFAACLGVFGNGELSHQKITKNHTQIEYEKYSRFESDMQISIHTKKLNDSLSVSIPQGYIEHFVVENITPQPVYVKIVNGEVVYLFDCDNYLSVNYVLKSKKIGSVKGVFKVNNTSLDVSHFIYP